MLQHKLCTITEMNICMQAILTLAIYGYLLRDYVGMHILKIC
jgi:hypothetical protein